MWTPTRYARQGWTISAIARHLGRDRKTVRAYLNGERDAGRAQARPTDPFDPFVDYCRDGWSRTRICGRSRCSTSSSRSASTGRIRR